MISDLPKANALLVMASLLSSCANLVNTAQQEDDVYFLPSQAPAVQASVQEPEAPIAEEPAQVPSDDYYDSDAAQQYAGPGSYYDATYNDPYYYNYGRFGFGTGLNMNSPYGWGFGSGPYSGWTGWQFSIGGGYFPSHWGGAWGMQPYGWYNDPWAWYNDPYYGGGYGYGSYWGPWGNYWCGYTPIVIGGSGNTLVGHRPSVSSSSRAENGAYQSRALYRDPVSLNAGRNNRLAERDAPMRAGNVERRSPGARPAAPNRTQRPFTPPTTERRTEHRAPVQRDESPSRGSGVERGGGDPGGGTRSAPSRSDGGGSRPPAHRSR